MSEASSEAKPKPVDMKFEIVVIPVSDVDPRRLLLEARLAARRDYAHDDDFRVLQFTPLAPAALSSRKNVTAAAPGSSQGLYLIVSDLEAARAELLRRGVEVSEVFHNEGVYAGTNDAYLLAGPSRGPDPEHRSYRSFPRSKIRMATAGFPGAHDAAARRIDSAATTFARPAICQRDAPRSGRSRQARERTGGQRDENWPDWYAAYMVAEQSGAKFTRVTRRTA